MFTRLTGVAPLIALCLSFPAARQLPSVSEAERLTTEAAALVAQATTAQSGIDTLQQALAIWRKAGNRSGEARALFLIGRGHHRLSRQEEAIAHYEQALTIQRELKDRAAEGRSLVQIGISYNALSRYDNAIERLDAAVAIAREVKDREDESIALSALGNTYNLLNRYDKAVEYLALAVAAAREIQNQSAEAGALNNLGSVQRSLRRYDQATESYQKALTIYRTLTDRSSEAGTLSNLAIVNNLLNRNDEAIVFYRQALDIHQELKNRTGEGIVLNNLGQSYIRLRQYEKAIENLEPALVIAREVKRRTGEGNTLTGLGDAHSALGYPERSIGYYEQALAIHREVKSRGNEATTLVTLSDLHIKLGRYESAIQALGRALAIARDLKDRATESSVLSTLADAYLHLGRSADAIDHYNQALVLARSVKDRSGEGIILNSLGQVYNTLERNEEALEYLQQGIAIARELKRPTSQTHALASMGEIYSRMAQHDRALEVHAQALAIAREAKYRPGEGLALIRLGDTHRKLGQLEKANEYLQPALAVARALKDPEAETMTLIGLARVARERGELAQARSLAEETLTLIESVRSQMFGRESRAAYFAWAQAANELHVDILMRMHKATPSAGYDALALDSSERRRARGLLELLTEAGMDVRAGVDPKLVERERALERQLNTLAASRLLLQGRTQSPESLASLERDITRLEQERESVEIEIRSTSPRYAAVAHPEPLATRDIQSDLLDNDTLLLEFLLGEERSYVWALSRGSLVSHELPKRIEVEAAVRNVLDLVSKRGTGVTDASRRLSQMVLGPVANQLRGKRLAIVPDGALQYVPFAMLPSPVRSETPLIVNHEIVTLPSASTLGIIRTELARRTPARDGIAVIADPVFSTADERMKTTAAAAYAGSPATIAGPENTRLLAHLAGAPGAKGAPTFIPRLPFTRQEADRILGVRPDATNLKAMDFTASKPWSPAADSPRTGMSISPPTGTWTRSARDSRLLFSRRSTRRVNRRTDSSGPTTSTT